MLFVVMVVGRVLGVGLILVLILSFLKVRCFFVIFLGIIFSLVRMVMVMGRLKCEFFLGWFVGVRFMIRWCDGMDRLSVENVVCICL